MVGGCGFVVAAGLGAWAAGECSEECCLCGEECCLCGPCDCLSNSSIRYQAGVFGYKCCGLLRSSTNNKIRVCGWCKFVFFLLFFLFFFFFVFLLGVMVFSE